MAATGDTMPDSSERRHFVVIAIRTLDAAVIARAIREEDLDLGCRPTPAQEPDGTWVLMARAPAEAVESLRLRGYAFEVVGDPLARARERLAEVGDAESFERGRPSRQGLVTGSPPGEGGRRG